MHHQQWVARKEGRAERRLDERELGGRKNWVGGKGRSWMDPIQFDLLVLLFLPSSQTFLRTPGGGHSTVSNMLLLRRGHCRVPCLIMLILGLKATVTNWLCQTVQGGGGDEDGDGGCGGGGGGGDSSDCVTVVLCRLCRLSSGWDPFSFLGSSSWKRVFSPPSFCSPHCSFIFLCIIIPLLLLLPASLSLSLPHSIPSTRYSSPAISIMKSRGEM